MNKATEYYENLRSEALELKVSRTENAFHHIMTPLAMFLNKKLAAEPSEKAGYGTVRKRIVIQKDNLPHSPALFIANHSNVSDVSSVYDGIKRQFYILADANQLHEPATRFFNGLIGATYVKRSTSNCLGLDQIPFEQSGRHAKLFIINRLLNGQNCLVFFEGTWNMSPNEYVLPVKWGTVEMAIAGKVPIVPVVLEYIYEKNLEIISIEKPLFYSEQADKRVAIEEIRSAIATRRFLLEEKYSRAEHASCTRADFEEVLIKNWLGYPVFPVHEEMQCVRCYDEFDQWKRRGQYDRLYWVHQEACRRYYELNSKK